MLQDRSRQIGAPIAVQPHIVQLLQSHLQRDPTKIVLLAGSMAPHCADYFELMTTADGGEVAVMTRGRGSQFTAQIQELLQRCDSGRVAQDQLLMLAQALDHPRCLLELTLATAGCEPQIRVGLRRSLHIEHALRLINADADVARDVRGFATLLARNTVSAIGLQVGPDANVVRYALHFTQTVTERRRESVRMRIAHAASRYAPSGAAVRCWAEHHDALLTPERYLLGLSFTPASSGLPAHVAIEYANVLPEIAALLRESRAAAVSEHFAQLCLRAARGTLSYLHVGLGAASLPELRGYAHVGAAS